MINNNIWVVVCDFMQILPFHMVKWVYKTPTKNNFTFKIGRFRVFFFSLALLFSLNKNRKSMRKKWNDLWCWFWIKYCQQTNTENVWNGIENKEWRSWFKLQSKERTKKNTTENKIWELSKMIDIQQWKNLSKNFIVPIALKNHPLQRIVCMLLYDTTKTWMIRTAKM